MATADANRVNMALVRETGFAEDPPDPTPTLQDIRFTSESLGQDTETTTSQEIRSDRQVPDVVRTNVGASGDTAHELSYGTFDGLLESAFLADSAFSSEVEMYNGSVATFDAGAQTVAAPGIDSSAVLGSWVLIEGATNPSNNGRFKITGIASGVLTLARGETSIVDESTGATVTVTMLSEITNGTTLNTYFIEKEYTDLTNTFEQLLGMAIQQWSLNIAAGSIITHNFGWIGSKAKSATSTGGDGSNTAATTTGVMNAVDNIVKIFEGSGTAADLSAQNIALQLSNNLRSLNKIGTLGAFELGTGSIDLTGTVQAYFEDRELIEEYLEFNDSHIATSIIDSANNRYILDVPRIRYTSARRVAGGINQDVIADMAWTAFRDPDEDVTIRLVRDDGS